MSREMKLFHSENRTHFTEKEYTGEEISLLKGACAPFDIEISGASRETADYVMCEGGSVQAVTDEPVSPSPDYPSEITPLTAAGTYKIGTKDAKYLIELPELYSAGVACDKLIFDKISKTARVKRECGDITFNGTENWAYVTIGGGYVRFMLYVSTNATGQSDSTANLLCDMFPSASWSGGVTNSENVHTYSGDNRIGVTIKAERLSENTANGFKAWLAENPIRVLYKLKTPTYTEITATKTSWAADNPEVPWKIYGKNLFSTERCVVGVVLKYTNISNNSFKFEGSNTSSSLPVVYFSLNLPAGTYRLTFKSTFKNSVSSELRPNEMMIRKNSYSGDIVGMWKMGGDCENKQRNYVFTINEDCTKLFFNFYPSVLSKDFTDYLMLIEDIQLEKGSTATDFEAYNAAPPESLTPSADYPHKIYPAENICIKCVKGETEKSVTIPFSGHGFSSGGEYVCDSLVYDSKTKTAKVISRINAKGLDSAKPLSEQSEAIRETPAITEVYASEGYDFSELKTYQGESTVFAGANFGDGTKGQLKIKVKVKEI